MNRIVCLIIFLLFTVKAASQCPTITLSSTSGSTCNTTPITIPDNVFKGATNEVKIATTGAGTVRPTSTKKSPFDFTYTPGHDDVGHNVTITITSNNLLQGLCNIAIETYILTVESTPDTPGIGTTTQPTCQSATGSVVLLGLPLTGTWTVNGSPGNIKKTGTGASTTISELTAGTYKFSVTSEGGCISNQSADVVINSPPAIPAIPQVSLNCSPGGTDVNVDSPTGAGLQYRLDNGVYQDGRIFSNVPTGSHTVTVKNSSGCETTSSSFQVFPPPSAPALGTVTQPSCTVTAGSVVLTGLPSSGTWTVTRSPGGQTTTGTGTSITISDLGPGTFTFTVTISNGCTSASSAQVAINQPVPVPGLPGIGLITQPSCSVSSGSVVLTGLPSGTWTLVRSPGDVASTGTGTSTTVTGLNTGTFTFKVTNSSGCTSPSSNNVVINSVPQLPVVPVVGVITRPTCSVPTGSVVLSGLPAPGSWTITRNPGNFPVSGTGTSFTVTQIPEGTYTFTVTSSSGCVSASTPNVVIPVAPVTPLAPLIGLITQPRFDKPGGSAVVNGLPATGAWTLNRLPGNIQVKGTGTTVTINDLAAGIYNFTVTNEQGCTSAGSASFEINKVSGPPLIVVTNPPPVCAPATVNISQASITTGSTPDLIYTYWIDAEGTKPYSTPGAAPAGTYYIKGTTSDGFFTIKPVIVSVYTIPVANAGPDQNMPNIFQTTMQAVLEHDYEKGVWEHKSGTGLFSDTTNPKAVVNGLSSGKNVFNWKVSNGACASAVDSVRINVGDFGNQTLITPNNDGKNDHFIVKKSESSGKIELTVFDRRGMRVYKNSDYDNSWDGVDYNGKVLPDDTYFYVAKDINGMAAKGYIVVRRF